MNDEQNKKLNDEVNQIIQSRFEFITRHYLSVRDAYNNHYDWPELDPLRHEICICITFGLCQAAITLTNHLLESVLKYALIIKCGDKVKQSKEDIKGRVITALIEKYRDCIEKYNDASLSNTINLARREGLISKEQKKQLHYFRQIFRNAYSHSDKIKTFGKSTMPVTGVRLEENKFVTDEVDEPEIAFLLVGQGIVQFEIAQKTAAQYFLYIDMLVRDIKDKLFPKEENS